MDSTQYRAFFSRAFLYDLIGELELAARDYRAALEYNTSNSFIFYNLGIVENKRRNFEEALKLFSRAIDLNPGNCDFLHNRGYTLKKLGNYTEAMKDFTKALRLDQNCFKARFNRAACLEKLGHYEVALEDLLVCLKNNPKDQDLILYVAQIEEFCGPKYSESAAKKYAQ